MTIVIDCGMNELLVNVADCLYVYVNRIPTVIRLLLFTMFEYLTTSACQRYLSEQEQVYERKLLAEREQNKNEVFW